MFPRIQCGDESFKSMGISNLDPLQRLFDISSLLVYPLFQKALILLVFQN